jgi:hypothetical protein
VRAYNRLKPFGEEDSLVAYHVPPIDHTLRGQSSWITYFCARDHTSKRLGMKPPEEKKE